MFSASTIYTVEFPDSLCARVLKARYYPRGNLVDTVFTGRASSSWQAIAHGVDLLKQGVIWRVGNGERIRIWRDPWLPRASTRRLFTPQLRSRYMKVSDLLLPGSMWNEQMVRWIFLPEDAKVILRIKTSVRIYEDFIAWHFEKNGIFSVRSAYKVGLDAMLNIRAVGSTSASPEGSASCWNAIWSGIASVKSRSLLGMWPIMPYQRCITNTSAGWSIVVSAHSVVPLQNPLAMPFSSAPMRDSFGEE